MAKRFSKRNYRTKGQAQENRESSTEDETDGGDEAIPVRTTCDVDSSASSTEDRLENDERSESMGTPSTSTTSNNEETVSSYLSYLIIEFLVLVYFCTNPQNNLSVDTTPPLARPRSTSTSVSSLSESSLSSLTHSDFSNLRTTDDSDSEEYQFESATMKQDSKEDCHKMVETLLAKPAPK